MPKHIKKRSQKVGLPPGTLVHIGEKKTEKAKVTYLDYDELHCGEREIENLDGGIQSQGAPAVTWINVDGLHQVEVLEKLGDHFGLHPLVLEDILNTDQRPKIDDYGGFLYIVLRMLNEDGRGDGIDTEQVSVILGPSFVISFQEREGDVFDPVRQRIRTGKGRIRKLGADYLAYSLLDSVVDNYFGILERLGEEIEVLEDELVTNPTRNTLHTLHRLKREMILLSRAVWPLREVISALERAESPLVKESTAIYLRDVYDHTIQVIDTIETYRDMLSGMLDIYLSSISNRMNEVMKVLTIIATIFIPITFVAGIYGMNFKYMPELEWPWAYPAVLFVMLAAAGSMLLYFRGKRWL
ncbi:MAG: magnesium/cobalt transporter CorA [Chloroflexi bacterium]|nr:magnesium/cobalt transporter CorA [Chloroflexota bacterium]